MVRRLDDLSGIDPSTLPPPSRAVLHSDGAALARTSVVKVEAVVRSCPRSSLLNVTGSGLVIARDHVLTNAHVIAGLAQALKVTTADGRDYQARVVRYDRPHDVAVLYVPGLPGTVLHFTGPASYGARAIVAGFPGGGDLKLAPATVGSSFTPHLTGTTAGTDSELQVYPVRAQVQPGNSGGPLIAPDGRVYGIIFARWDAPQSGLALTASEVIRDATAGANLTARVPAPGQPSC